MTTTTTDIGQLASEAVTALSDPGAVGIAGGGVDRWEQQTDYACERLNAIIGVTDPVDDEREIDRCADSLDVLGRHVEKIRAQIVAAMAHYGHHHGVETVSDHVTSALDLIDEAGAVLREIAATPDQPSVAGDGGSWD